MRRRETVDKMPLADRLRIAFLKPAEPGSETISQPRSVEEVEGALKADDKERLIGLLAAPFAAAIGLLITDALIAHDPAAYLKSGLVNKLHVSVALYHEVMIALVVLSVVMLLSGWFRKRLYLGITMALYGLTVFNLHYWGFGVPYLLCAGWLIVRAYRAQRAVREATSEPSRIRPGGGELSYAARPRANRPYTPPTSRSRS